MAATSGPSVSTPATSSVFSPCSSIVKQVHLYDWWLFKAEDMSSNCRRLSVGGINSKGRLGIRAFHSAAIVKRHNAVTLETADGIVVNLCGTINRSRMLQNGFSQKVCNHFLFGFPYYWEEFVHQLFPEDSSERPVRQGLSNLTGVALPVDGLNTFSPGCFDDLPVALIRDVSHSFIGDSANCGIIKSIFGDIVQKYGNRANDEKLSSESKKSDPTETRSSTDKDTLIRSKKRTAQQKYNGEGDSSGIQTRGKTLRKTALKESCGFESNALRKGPLTRSMAHSSKERK